MSEIKAYLPIKTFKLRKIINTNGSLVPIDLKKFSKFRIKRFFILYGKKNDIRGNHAHKKCTQIFIALSGKAELKISNKKTKKKIILSFNKNKGVYVEPLNWCIIKFLKKNSSILVLCNYKFSEKEYIRKFKNFLKY